MISIEIWLTYTLACVLIILSPGPDNILAVSRGLRQGRLAAVVTSVGAGFGLMIQCLQPHLVWLSLLIIQRLQFFVVKIVGVGYLIWLGLKVLKSGDLISFSSEKKQLPSTSVFITGFLTNVLNPKPALFVPAFVPQFISQNAGHAVMQTTVLGSWFAILAIIIFSLLGSFSAELSSWLEKHPKGIVGLNIGAGLTFVTAGLSIAFLQRVGLAASARPCMVGFCLDA